MTEDLGKSRQQQEDDKWLEAFESLLYGPPNYRELRKLLVQTELEQMVRLARTEHAETIAALQRLQAAAEKHVAREASKSISISPPPIAAFLLSFLAPRNSAQAFLGDLEEMFQKNVERLGEKQARRKYWMQVASSFGPQLWQWLKRVGFFTVLVDYFRSKFGL